MIHFTAVGLRLTADEPQKHHDIDAVTLRRIVAVTQSQNSLHLSHHPGFFLHLAHDGSADSDVISCIVSFWYRHRANLARFPIALISPPPDACQESNAC